MFAFLQPFCKIYLVINKCYPYLLFELYSKDSNENRDTHKYLSLAITQVQILNSSVLEYEK